ncbi:MAG: hypothetical protein CL518_02290 [Actinobacteria bacterium]|nr:hypothetical protein [Actinomycetota bacterium]MBK77391.1 hypothetical protein [Actinomycetota bacterium]|tara:strand:- start:74 stop:667 length:594 start_codon:yes stop_codon:yes gene_type:complete
MKAAIILAAGESTRMGFPKQLAEYKGNTILETVVETVSSYIENTVVVLGHENETLTEKINFKNSTILINENWEEGIVSSIRTGLFYLNSAKNIDGVLIFMGDQPAINNDVIKKLLEVQHDEDEVVVPQYRYETGYPVLIPRFFWNKLELITQDDLDGDDSVFKNFELIDYFETSETKIKILNFNFLKPTDYDEQSDF